MIDGRPEPANDKSTAFHRRFRLERKIRSIFSERTEGCIDFAMMFFRVLGAVKNALNIDFTVRFFFSFLDQVFGYVQK